LMSAMSALRSAKTSLVSAFFASTRKVVLMR
jgi:hypothetical protein